MLHRSALGFVAVALVAVCASCAGGPATGPNGPGAPQVDVLATGLGAVAALEVGDGTAYVLTGPSADRSLKSVALAGGATSPLAAGIAGAVSLAPIPGACVYADSSDGNAYMAAPGSAPELVSKGFRGEVGLWLCSAGATLCYARADGSAVAAVGLSAPGGAGDDPVAPPQLLRVLGTAQGPELLAATDTHVIFAHKGRSELARIPRQGGPVAPMNTALGALVDVDAAGPHSIAAGAKGVVADGRTLTTRTGVVAVAVAGDRLFYATKSAVYEATSAGEARMAAGEGITHLAGTAGAVVFADQSDGGRLLIVDLTSAAS